VPLQKPEGLPIGVQVIANHYKEESALRVARYLEKEGVASAPAA
jgi:aspartyl-tRNA(Asn)/glutamyl-tRNA(Gln) amidotransferase subunit A